MLNKFLFVVLMIQISIYGLAHSYTPVLATPGNGNCGEGAVAKDEKSPFAYAGDQVISWMSIKASSDQSTDGSQCIQLSSNGSNGCYDVTGIGTNAVTVTKIGTEASCKVISHVEFYRSVHSPTPTTFAPSPTPVVPLSTPTPTTVAVTNTPTPNPTGNITITPTPTSRVTATPVPTPTIPDFPACPFPTDGDVAHYETGWHQIVGGPLLEGADDVYSIGNGNYVQCFCPPQGAGIQTNWFRTDTNVPGWYHENGAQWNLGNFQYSAQNLAYNCNEPTPTVTQPSTGSPTPTPTQGSAPSVTPGPSVTATPTNVPSIGGSSTGGGQPISCPDPKPGTPTLLSVARTSGTTMQVKWTSVSDATSYSILYGTEQGHYTHSVIDTGKVTDYTIGDLDPNRTYYAVVMAKNGCMPGDPAGLVTGGGTGATGGADILGANTLAATGSADMQIAWYAVYTGMALMAASLYGNRRSNRTK